MIRKLFGPDGLDGHLSYPDRFDTVLQSLGGCTIPISPRANFSFGSEPVETTIKTFSIVRDYKNEGGVYLEGITLEQVELLPGFAFYPSAAYIRRMIP